MKIAKQRHLFNAIYCWLRTINLFREVKLVCYTKRNRNEIYNKIFLEMPFFSKDVDFNWLRFVMIFTYHPHFNLFACCKSSNTWFKNVSFQSLLWWSFVINLCCFVSVIRVQSDFSNKLIFNSFILITYFPFVLLFFLFYAIVRDCLSFAFFIVSTFQTQLVSIY